MSIWEKVSIMDDEEVSNSILLDLDEDIYEYLHSEELQDETNEVLSYFFALISRKIAITEEEGDRIDNLLEVFDVRLKEIIDILGEDEDQYIACIDYGDYLVIEKLLIFLYSKLDNKLAICRIIEHILNMENDNERVNKITNLVISMIGVDFTCDDIDIFETIISNTNWIRMKEAIDNMLLDEPNLYEILKEKISLDTCLSDYY